MTDPEAGPEDVAAATGAVAVIQRAPFAVARVVFEGRWDPSSESLPVSWELRDPDRQIVRGRIVYKAADSEGVHAVVATEPLTAEELAPAVLHQLPAARQWDGTLPDAIGPRAGSKVTADLAPNVSVEVWSTDVANPEAPTERALERGAARPTTREGEWCAALSEAVPVDCIVEASWGSEACVPYPLTETLFPEERDDGEVSMRIRVRNVDPSAVVAIEVYRIVDSADPATDRLYAAAGGATEQPGLEDLTIQDGRIKQADGQLPSVRFNSYDEHWVVPGNNFYCFRVAFGSSTWIDASSRDPAADEAGCLHMRFTVFIHNPPTNLPASRAESRAIYTALRRSRFFRPYYQGAGTVDAQKLAASYRHRYIVIFSGHGSAWCNHPDHPRLTARGEPAESAAPAAPATGTGDPAVSEDEARGPHLLVLPEGFDPDHYQCPEPNAAGRAALPSLETRIRTSHSAYADVMTYGWCLQASFLFEALHLGPLSGALAGDAILYGRAPGQLDELESQHQPLLRLRLPSGGTELFVSSQETPRLAFFADACRTILGTGLGLGWSRSGTRFYHGWTYSVADTVGLMEAFVRRWLPAQDGSIEGDPQRLVADYQAVASQAFRASYHPRLMEGGTPLLAGSSPGATAEVLE